MKKFKSVLVFLLSLIIVFSAFPSTVFAENYKYSSVERISAGAGFDNYAKTDVTLPYTLSVDRAQKDFNTIYINTGKPFKLSSGDNFTITVRIGATATRYKDFEIINFGFQGFAGEESLNDDFLQTGYQKYYDYNTSSIIFTGVSERDLTECYFNVWIQNPIVSPESLNKNFSFTVHSVTVDVESEQSGFFNKVSNFFSDLFNRLTSWFDNLFQWLKDIRDGNVSFAESVKTLFSNITNSIKGFFSELGTKLTDGFKNLTNSISTFFTNLGNNLKDWFDDVGQWFTDIGDRIGEFFTSLWNKIWYGNEKGESEYQKPVINNKFNDILETLTEYQEQLQGTISTISASADSVSAYISTGTQLVNGVINVAGAGFTALIVFGMVFVLVRKVVGR